MFPMNQWHFNDFDEQVFQRMPHLFMHLFIQQIILSTYFLPRIIIWCHALTWLTVLKFRTGSKWEPVVRGHLYFMALCSLWYFLSNTHSQLFCKGSLLQYQLAFIGPGSLPCSRHIKATAVSVLRGLVQPLLESCSWECEPKGACSLLTPLQSYWGFLQTLTYLHFFFLLSSPNMDLWRWNSWNHGTGFSCWMCPLVQGTTTFVYWEFVMC